MELKAVLFLQYSRLALTRLVPAAFAAAAGFAGAQSPAAAAPQETVLYSFTGGTDGVEPLAGLIAGPANVLYGTTPLGGTSGYGTVFQLTPPAPGLAQWTESVLYSFNGGKQGSQPAAGLIFGANGALYGTTYYGGTLHFGTVFQLTPPATGHTRWTETVLYNFMGGNDGANPGVGLIFDANGALYGTTAAGGTSGGGTVFQLTPPATGQTQWTETALHSFGDGNDGAYPEANVIFGANGALYGTTNYGGTLRFGTVFQLTPPATGQTQWTETVVYSFTGKNGGQNFVGGVIFDENGALYGTTVSVVFGTASNNGTVFQLTPPATGQTQWTETVLHSFNGGNGFEPMPSLIFGENGKLYGTTEFGGTLSSGTLFQLTPPAVGQTAWSYTVRHSFGATGDGDFPLAGLIFGANGTFYGTTASGGASGNGTVFQLTQ